MVMCRITLKVRKALELVLKDLLHAHPRGVLMFGECASSKQHFCKVVDLGKCTVRLLSCTRLKIAHFSHFNAPTVAFCAFLKGYLEDVPQPWHNLVSPARWIEYNIDKDLYCLNLGVGTVDYYILLRAEYLVKFRTKAYLDG